MNEKEIQQIIERLSQKILDDYTICYAPEEIMTMLKIESGLSIEAYTGKDSSVICKDLNNKKIEKGLKEYHVKKDDFLKNLLDDSDFENLAVVIIRKIDGKDWLSTGLHVDRITKEDINDKLKMLLDWR